MVHRYKHEQKNNLALCISELFDFKDKYKLVLKYHLLKQQIYLFLKNKKNN